MNIKRILGLILFLAFFSVVFIWADSYSRRPYPLSSTRVVIPDTNVSVQIPEGLLYNPTGLYIFEDPYKTFATPIFLLKNLALEPLRPDQILQSSRQTLNSFFRGDVPEKQSIGEFEVYLRLEDWPIHPESIRYKGLILYGNEQYISVDMIGPSTESRQIYALVEAVLNSMEIEE